MLSLKNIKKDYILSSSDCVHALRGVTLNFRKGEFVSILGPSGCGKTTLMNIIGGLDKYTEGDLVIDGKSTKDFTDYDWDNYRNKKIGFVFQTYNLIPHLSVLANVELALTLSGISPDERKRRGTDALQKVGLGDQLHKKPNQLSGGQMQRVAIARALVNEPDVLLADEPTGALDTATSEQIMNLIREVAQDKLVIMVTHNPTLAEKYSTRLIKMLDGVITDDTSPYTEEVVPQTVGKKTRKKRSDKTSMSFFTALSLSFRNLFTKKARTILTAIAGSIGIIGISLILSISNGMNSYIEKLTTDTLSGNPITVSEVALNIEQALNSVNSEKTWEKYPLINKILVRVISDQQSILKRNVITEEYLSYLEENVAEELYNDVLYQNGQEMNIYTTVNGTELYLSDTSRWNMAVNNDFLSGQYDVLAGTLPESHTDLILVVDEYNRLTDTVLNALGLKSPEEKITELDFSSVIGKEYYILNNDGAYKKIENRFLKNEVGADADFSQGITARISCIVRLKQNTDMGVLSTGINFTQGLYDTLCEQNMNTELVQWMKNNVGKNPTTGADFISFGDTADKDTQYQSALRKYGGNPLPNSISVYAVDFDAKEEIKNVMRAYNDGKEEADIVSYTDMSEIMGGMLGSMVDIISYILIAFTAISLVVSSVMIGIITYVSVIERTKEIGILRAIGARKKDITRVFNAETVIIGLFAGIIGEAVTFVLTFPINAIIFSLTETNNIAKLNPLHALIMIVVSIILTLISGLIPAIKASKKDPVLALRTE